MMARRVQRASHSSMLSGAQRRQLLRCQAGDPHPAGPDTPTEPRPLRPKSRCPPPTCQGRSVSCVPVLCSLSPGPGPPPPEQPAPPHLCDVSTTERPSRTTARRLFQRKRRELGSMPVVGSSLGVQAACRKPSPCLPPGPAPAPPPLTRKTTAGSPTSATAVASFLLLPPL